MTNGIHPSAIIDPKAELGSNVTVGPGCVIRGAVTLADGVELLNHVTIDGPVRIGTGTVIYSGACIGFPPQDVKFKRGSPTAGVVIGRNTLVREHVTIHAATKLDHPTTVGDNCFLMVNSHLGHDARIGNNVTLVNSVLLAGHVHVGDSVTMGGSAAVHQFCRVGRLSMVSGLCAVAMDVPPFCIIGTRNLLAGLNAVGLRRNNVPRDDITLLRKAFRATFVERVPREEMLARLAPLAAASTFVAEFRDFIAAPTKRGICAAGITLRDEADATA